MFTGFSFHHIGYATTSIKVTAAFFESIGYHLSDTIMDVEQHVNIALLSKENTPLIELVEVIDEKSPVNNIVKKNGVTAYHICYEVEEIEKAISFLKKKRFVLLFKPVVAVALESKLICYLYHKDVGLIELLQK